MSYLCPAPLLQYFRFTLVGSDAHSEILHFPKVTSELGQNQKDLEGYKYIIHQGKDKLFNQKNVNFKKD